jgi:hypothetical protein
MRHDMLHGGKRRHMGSGRALLNDGDEGGKKDHKEKQDRSGEDQAEDDFPQGDAGTWRPAEPRRGKWRQRWRSGRAHRIGRKASTIDDRGAASNGQTAPGLAPWKNQRKSLPREPAGANFRGSLNREES